MNNKPISVVVASFIVLASSSSYAQREVNPGTGPRLGVLSHGPTFLTPPDGVPDFSTADIWTVRCVDESGPICADVNSFGFFGDNNVFVNVTCDVKGRGDTEFTPGGLGGNACTGVKCKNATVLFHGDDADFTDEEFESLIHCVGRDLREGFPQHKQDND